MAARVSHRALRFGALGLGVLTAVALTLALPGSGHAASNASGGFTVPQEKSLPGFEVADTAPPAAAVSNAGKPIDMAGHYALLREGGKDSGCVLTLVDTSGADGGLVASLSPACKDRGLQTFDPMSWRMDKDKLVLAGRKAHNSVRFNLQADGSWQRDGEMSRPLILKKL